MKNFRKKGSLLATTAVSIVSWLFLAYVAFVINTSPFHVLTAVRTAHQAQQYADIIADTLKNTSYDSVTTKAHARQNITSEVPGVTGWQSEVTMSGETTIGESVQRIATIKIYKPGDTLSRYSVQVPLSSQSNGNNLPIGSILPFYGNLSSIPNDWHLCDGTNGTPDLRNRFIVGAGSSYTLGSIGGEATHILSIPELPSHAHSLNNNFNTSYIFTKTMWYLSGEFDDNDGGGGVRSWGESYKSSDNVSIPGTISLSGNTITTGNNQPHENRPPYYALYYIMRIK